MTDADHGALQEAARTVPQGLCGPPAVVTADLSTAAGVSSAVVGALDAAGGRIDILVSNAGAAGSVSSAA